MTSIFWISSVERMEQYQHFMKNLFRFVWSTSILNPLHFPNSFLFYWTTVQMDWRSGVIGDVMTLWMDRLQYYISCATSAGRHFKNSTVCHRGGHRSRRTLTDRLIKARMFPLKKHFGCFNYFFFWFSLIFRAVFTWWSLQVVELQQGLVQHLMHLQVLFFGVSQILCRWKNKRRVGSRDKTSRGSSYFLHDRTGTGRSNTNLCNSMSLLIFLRTFDYSKSSL